METFPIAKDKPMIEIELELERHLTYDDFKVLLRNMPENFLTEIIGVEWYFGMLAKLNQQYLYNYANKRLHNYEDAQEIVQEALLRAYENILTFSDEQLRTLKGRAWLFRIVHNLICNHIRDRQSIQHYLAENGELLEMEGNSLERPEMKALRNENVSELCDLMSELSVEDSRILLLYWTGYTYDFLAQAFDCSLSAVCTRVNRAKRRFREIVQSADVEVGTEAWTKFLQKIETAHMELIDKSLIDICTPDREKLTSYFVYRGCGG